MGRAKEMEARRRVAPDRFSAQLSLLLRSHSSGVRLHRPSGQSSICPLSTFTFRHICPGTITESCSSHSDLQKGSVQMLSLFTLCFPSVEALYLYLFFSFLFFVVKRLELYSGAKPKGPSRYQSRRQADCRCWEEGPSLRSCPRLITQCDGKKKKKKKKK